MTLKISIAMCTFNGAYFLKEQLDSILYQTTLPDEMIICDDGSTDDTIKMVEQFQKHAPFLVKLYKNETLNPLGSTKNFEKAISLCSGDVILLSDQDDVWFSSKVEMLVREVVNGADIVFSNAELVDENLKPLNRSLFDSLSLSMSEKRLLKKENLFEVLIKRNIVTGAAMAFSSKYLNLILPISNHWVHDGWIAILIAYQGRFKIIPQALFQYRQHGKNQIGAKKMSVFDKIRKSKETADIYYCNLLNCFQDVGLRLKADSSNYVNNYHDYLLNQKILFVNKRTNIQKLRIFNFISFTVDLITGSYHKYSRGHIGYFRDLVIIFSQNNHQ